MKFVIDMMGGDNGVDATVPAIKEFASKHEDITFFCVGKIELLNDLENIANIKLIPSYDVLKMDVDPMDAMHSKGSSLNIATDVFIKEKADCLISAGSTAALVSEGIFKVKRLPGIKRPCLMSPFPTQIQGKFFVGADLGANAENTPENIDQFARMSTTFYKLAYGKENPTVHLLNIGTEEEKGNALTKETYNVLKNDNKINFKGNIEAREPLKGNCDIVVCDGYSGNIFLKATEGACKVMSNLIKKSFKKNLLTKIGYLFSKKGFDDLSKTMDYKSTGGAMLLGINGLLIKAHGSSDKRAFISSLNVGLRLAEKHIIEKIKEEL